MQFRLAGTDTFGTPFIGWPCAGHSTNPWTSFVCKSRRFKHLYQLNRNACAACDERTHGVEFLRPRIMPFGITDVASRTHRAVGDAQVPRSVPICNLSGTLYGTRSSTVRAFRSPAAPFFTRGRGLYAAFGARHKIDLSDDAVMVCRQEADAPAGYYANCPSGTPWPSG